MPRRRSSSTPPCFRGAVSNIAFELAGQAFIALNGGPEYPFTLAISLFVSCESQAEVDDMWTKLLAGGGKPDASPVR